MAGVACKQPQTTYEGLQKSLWQEWDFVQCVTLYIGTMFQTMEDVLLEAFLPDLFKGVTSQIPKREFIGMPDKQAGVDLPDPT